MSEYDDELKRMFDHRDKVRAQDEAQAKKEAEEFANADIIYLDESQYHTVTDLNLNQKNNYSQSKSARSRSNNRVRSRARYNVPKGLFQSMNLKPHHIMYAIACALSVGTLVHFLTPKPLETDSLTDFMKNPTAISEVGVSYDSIQSLKDFAEEYKEKYDQGDFSEKFLEENYSKYRQLAEDIFKSKVSQATGVPQDIITVTKPFPASEVTIGIRDTNYKGPETVVSARFNNSDERLSSDLLSVASPLYKAINIDNEVSPFGLYSKAQIKNEAGFLYGYIQDLVSFSQMQVIYVPLDKNSNNKSLVAVNLDENELEQANNINQEQIDDKEI